MTSPLSILSLLILLAGATAPAVELDPATTKGNVTIQFPKGWAAVPGNGRSLLSAHPKQIDKDATGEFQANFSITQDAGTKVDAAAQQTVLSKQVTNYKVIEAPTPVATAAGLQGVFFGGTFTNNKTEFRSRQYMFLVNNQIYTLTFTCLNSQWPNYQPAIEASVATLTVKH